MKLTIKIVVVGVFLICTSFPGFAADWPHWRGPDSNGVSKETNWTTGSLKSGPAILWRAEIGEGHSGPVVVDGRLFTVGNTGAQDVISCFNAETGKKIWTHGYSSETGNYGGPRATPTVVGDYLYMLSRWGDVLCLEASTGEVVWQRNILAEIEVLPKYGLSGSPVANGNRLILNAGAAGIALDRTTGKTLWSGGPGSTGYATPVIFKHAGKDATALFTKKHLAILDVATGAELLDFPWETKYHINAADPVISGNRVFISSGYGKGSALLDIGGDAPKVVWESADMRNHFSSCILLGDALYGIDGKTGSGALSCVRFTDGKLLWSQKGGFEAMTAAGDRLILIDKRGNLIIAEASPSGYAELARAQVLSTPKTKFWTAPVLANGRIFCRSSTGELAAIDVREK